MTGPASARLESKRLRGQTAAIRSALALCLCLWTLSPQSSGLASGLAQKRPVRGFEFSALPDLPDPIGFGGPLVGVHGEALIVAGGANFPVPLTEGGAKVWHDEVFVLVPGAKAWISSGTLPRPLAYAATATTSRGVVCVGGSDAEAVYADSFLMTWDPRAGEVKCAPLPPFPVPSAFGSAEAIGDRVFVLAGKKSKDDADLAGAAWHIDLAAPVPAWSPMAPMPGPARFKVVTAVQRGPRGIERESNLAATRLYGFSGSAVRPAGAPHGIEHFTDGYRYSPESNAWTRVADLPALVDPRGLDPEGAFAGQRWPINAGAAHGYGERSILTFSGTTGRYIFGPGGELTPPAERPFFAPRVLRYDTLNDSWTEAGPMPEGVVTTRTAYWNERIVIPSGEVKPGVRTPKVQSLAASAPGAAKEGQPMDPKLSKLDYIVLGLYLLFMVAIGAHFARRETTTEEFFLGGRRIPWWAAGLSIFGTQLSAITFMAIPATAYGTDWRRFVGQLMVLPVFVLVIAFFLPVFRRLNVTTAYEFLELRFSRTVRLCASGLFILFQLGRMGIVLFLPAIALSAVTGVDTYACIAFMGVLATVYTALGGISAVIWTDVLQVVVLIGGATVCLFVAVSGAGGLGAALDAARDADKLAVFDWRWGTSEMAGWVLIVGFFFTNLVPYATDQTVVQRYLTTRNEKEAAKSLWLNFAITVPTGLLFFGLGTALWAYFDVNPVKASLLPAQPDQLVPWFVVSELPSGVAGLLIAGILAAAMSSLDSSMNSISTAIVNDFLPGTRDHTGTGRGHRLDFVRGLTVALGVLGTLAAMFLATFEVKYLFDAFQRVIGLLGGGVAGVFVLAIFTRTTNATGALWGLAIGGALTVTVALTTDVNFLLYAGIGTAGCILAGSLISHATGGNQKDLTGLLGTE